MDFSHNCKTLHACVDGHIATKFIFKIFGCELGITDTNTISSLQQGYVFLWTLLMILCQLIQVDIGGHPPIPTDSSCQFLVMLSLQETL
jgi:hypothetical protein